MIDAIQVKAKINDEQRRMANNAIAIDFYNGQIRQHMECVADYIYSETAEDMKKYLVISGIVQTIIDQTAVLFQSPPEINIETESKPIQGALAEVLANAELWKKLIIADRMAELTKKVGLAVHWHPIDQRVVIDVITPDRCHVIEDEYDPTKAKAVYYCIGTSSDTNRATRVNQYACWTREKYYECELGTNLQEIKVIPGTEVPNRYGNQIPIAWLPTLLETESFWVDHGFTLIEAAINIILRESNFDVALDFQSFSTLVTSGLNSDESLKTGIKRRLDIPPPSITDGDSKPEAYFITPDAKLSEVSAAIEKKRINAAKESHLSAEAFNQDTSKVNSGYQLRLSERQLEEHNNLLKEVWRPEIIKLVKLIITCHNLESSGTMQIPANLPINITYSERKFAANPLEVTSVQLTKIQAGLMSVADAIRENNPDLTQEKAIEEAKRIKQEADELRGASITPITDEDLA